MVNELLTQAWLVSVFTGATIISFGIKYLLEGFKKESMDIVIGIMMIALGGSVIVYTLMIAGMLK